VINTGARAAVKSLAFTISRTGTILRSGATSHAVTPRLERGRPVVASIASTAREKRFFCTIRVAAG
jgi:hypothetical protein